MSGCEEKQCLVLFVNSLRQLLRLVSCYIIARIDSNFNPARVAWFLTLSCRSPDLIIGTVGVYSLDLQMLKVC